MHVAVGIMVRGPKVFISQRALSSPLGGKWEFPGGKLAPGETALAGLKRELWEELGIEVQEAAPLMRVPHTYPDLDVLLDVWCVKRYHGEPRGKLGQATRWVELSALAVDEFPAADRPIIRRLQLPHLYLITDTECLARTDFLSRLEEALQAGARLIQLRAPHLANEEFYDLARAVTGLGSKYGATVLLNADPEAVMRCGAAGVHLNSRRLWSCERRPLPPALWVAASCHNETELVQAQKIDADFVVLGPVQETKSHPQAVPLGWERFAALCRATTLPIYALGGMTVGDLSRAEAAGAIGVAMISAIWEVSDINKAVAKLARV